VPASPPEQDAYADAAQSVFNELDRLETQLADSRFLFGTSRPRTDWRLFVTLIRFDAVYVGHFKCNLRRIVDYPNLGATCAILYQFRNVAATVNFDHIKRHYYMTHDEINPTRIVRSARCSISPRRTAANGCPNAPCDPRRRARPLHRRAGRRARECGRCRTSRYRRSKCRQRRAGSRATQRCR